MLHGLSKRAKRFVILGNMLVIAAVFCSFIAADEAVNDYPNLNDQWQKNYKNLIFNFNNMYQPNIVYRQGSEYPYKMWFFGWAVAPGNPGYSGCDAIYYARSKDLDNWEIYSKNDEWDTTMDPTKWMPVISADNKIYDQWHNGDPSVVYYEGRYYMAFSSTGFDKDGQPSFSRSDTDGDLGCVMGATSEDGIHWTKTEAPLVMNKKEIGVRETYTINEAYSGDYERPCLMRDEGKWKLWFDFWDGKNGGHSMAYAENSGSFADASQWKVMYGGEGKEPLLKHWPNSSVVKVGKTYYCYADPPFYTEGGRIGWEVRQIYEAVSDDGINWKITGIIKPDADTPACQIPEAFYHERDGKKWLYIFYACQIGGDPYDYRYNRIRYMKKEIIDPEAGRENGNERE